MVLPDFCRLLHSCKWRRTKANGLLKPRDHDDGRLASAQREVLKQCAEFEKMLKEQEFKDRKMASPYQTPVDFT